MGFKFQQRVLLPYMDTFIYLNVYQINCSGLHKIQHYMYLN
jgi:hypothetical protein